MTHIVQWPEGPTSDSMSHGQQVGEWRLKTMLCPTSSHLIPALQGMSYPLSWGGRREPAGVALPSAAGPQALSISSFLPQSRERLPLS